MNVPDNILFECVAGSKAYGTDTPESDTDIRGVYSKTLEQRLTLRPSPDQVSDKTNDTVYYELEKFMQLAANCNPNIIELLWTPPTVLSEVGEVLIANRHLFISEKAKHTFAGYAHSQVQRAKGQNKWINNPQPKDLPSPEKFCWFLDDVGNARRLDMNHYSADSVMHVPNVYRLYDGEGVFKNGQLVTKSIPKDAELRGLIYFNKDGYETAKRDHKNYWDWKKNRNEARYRDQESGVVDYDCKNMMHCIRLLWSGLKIMECGYPIVRFAGEKLSILKSIREGKLKYEEVLDLSEQLMDELNNTKCQVRKSANMKEIDLLYRGLVCP